MPNAYGDLATGTTATPAPPSLGYGQRAEAPIDAVNQWMRTQPWYTALIKSFGQDPSNVHLNDSQKQQVIKAAQAAGVVVDEGHNGQEVDDSGNFQAKSHALRNTLIVAGIAGAALVTAGVAGVFGGATAGGVEAGATAGLGTAALPGAMATIPALAGTAGAATAAGTAAATGTVAAAGGASTLAGVAGPAAAATAAKGIPSWLAPVLGTVVPTVGGLIGATIQSNAATDAEAKRQEGIKAALDFEKQQYADLNGRLQPYIQAGTTSTDRMSQLLGLPARTDTTATAAPARGPAVQNYNAPTVTGMQPAASVGTQPLPRSGDPGQMVTLQAPNGEVQAVPANQVDHYVGLGAKVLQGAA